MIEWTDAERQAASLIGQYEEIENTLVRNIAKRLQVDDPIGGTLEWQLQKLSDVGALTRENVEAIARMSGRTAAEVEKVISDVGLASIAKDEKIYQEALARGLLKTAAVPVGASESVKQILQAAASNATSYLNLVNTTAVASAQQAFIQAVDQAYLEVSAGIYDYQSSIRRQVKKLAEAGITGVQYKRKDGTTVNYPMDAAVRRAVLTSTSQAANRLQLQRASDYGAEYVEVNSHITARPTHAVWQGRVYKLNGAEKGFPNFYEATHYGDADGLGGINCRHSFFPFFKGISERTYPHYDEEECRKAYEESQVQRSYENQIRALKREAVAADAMGDKETFDKVSSKLKAKQGELNDFMDSTGRRQTQRVGSVGYGRSQAAKSTASARRQTHEQYADYLGTTKVGETNAKVKAITDNGEKWLLDGYVNAVKKGDISALVGIDTYIDTARSLASATIGKTARDGTTMTSYTTHLIDRVIGQTSTPHGNMREGVTVQAIADCLTGGGERTIIKGAGSTLISDGIVRVAVNPNTGKIVTCYKYKK